VIVVLVHLDVHVPVEPLIDKEHNQSVELVNVLLDLGHSVCLTLDGFFWGFEVELLSGVELDHEYRNLRIESVQNTAVMNVAMNANAPV
jgi:hypothetical protein